MGGIKGNNKAASGFREFMKEQRKIHALSGSKCEPKIEIRLSSNQKQHQNMETMIIEPQLTIVCAKTDDESNIAKAPLADLTGCSKWIYDIFQTSRKDQWKDGRSFEIDLHLFTRSVIDLVIKFARLEKAINPSCSYLQIPPSNGHWASIEDAKLRKRAVFQFPVDPDVALELCHAASFLQIPGLLDVSCSMLGYYIDDVPSTEGLDDWLIVQILSRVSPLKLLLLQNLPTYQRFSSQMVDYWTQQCESCGLDELRKTVTFAWSRFAPSTSTEHLQRHYDMSHCYVEHAFTSEVGKLATAYRAQKRIEESAAATATLANSDRTTLKPTSPLKIPLDTECNFPQCEEEDSNAVSVLNHLDTFQSYIHSVCLTFPMESHILTSLKHLHVLQIRDIGLWPEIAEAISGLHSISILILDGLLIEGPRNLDACYSYFDEQRDQFWSDIRLDPLLDSRINHGPHFPLATKDLQSPLFSLLKLLQVAATLPSLDHLQISCLDCTSMPKNYDFWSTVLLPHWRLKNQAFFPNLRSLSLFGSLLRAFSISMILSMFQQCSKLEILDISSNSINLCDSNLYWMLISDWNALKVLNLSGNSLSNDHNPPSFTRFMPSNLETLGFEFMCTLGDRHDFWRSFADSSVTGIKDLYFQGSSLQGDDILRIANSPQLTRNLKFLDLRRNGLTNSSLVPLERVFLNAPNLEEIVLGSQSFSGDGLERLVATLSLPEYNHIHVIWDTASEKSVRL